ncbi:MAG: glycosyltransferase [Erysipelotrichaceae bacterium]|nr:glycosyltransferase [Erysipelotrichaceae bacterium]
MRVLYINSVIDFGSTGRIVRDLANAQTESLVCFGRKTGRSEDYRMTALPGNIEGALAAILFDRNGFANRKETRRLVALIREYDPDIIHLHNLHGYYLNIETLFDFLKQYKKPVVWTLHDCWSYTGYCPYYDAAGCEKWKTGCKACPYPFAYPFSLFKQHTSENYERKKQIFNGVGKLTIVTPSVWLKNEVQHSFLSAYPVRVIPNGIDLKNFNPEGRKKNGTFSILFAASYWTREKGSEEIQKLLPLLNKDIRVVIIGQGSEAFKNAPNVTALPRTSSQAELAGHYRNADLFVNLTLQDNFPTVNIEALNCGTPVITYATGGSPEIADEKTGAVVPKGDYKAMAELINRLSTENPFLAAECEARGKRFSVANMAAAYASLYKELYTISD